MNIFEFKGCPLCGREIMVLLFTDDTRGASKLECGCPHCGTKFIVSGNKTISRTMDGETVELGEHAVEIWNRRYYENNTRPEA